MLRTDRKQHEVIWIHCPDGEQIAIHIDKIREKEVKLGIDAPRAYKIKLSKSRDDGRD